MKATELTYRFGRILLALVFVLTASGVVVAQDEEDAGPRKLNVKISYFQLADNRPEITVTTSYREDRRVVYQEGVLINLYYDSITREGMMGSLNTNENGQAVFTLPDKFDAMSDTNVVHTFYARLANDDRFVSVDKKITIQEAYVELDVLDEDSIKWLIGTFTKPDSSGERVPVAEEETKFYAQRLFSRLPIGGDYTYTEDDGTVSIEFPQDLPKDIDGSTEVVFRVEEHDEYGTLEARTRVEWGAERAEIVSGRRELWSTNRNAPLVLLLSTVAIVLGVWGVLAYLVLKLFRIRKA